MRRWWLLLPPLVLLILVVLAAAGWQDLSSARAQLSSARESLTQAVDDPAALRTSDGRRAARLRIEQGTRRLRNADHRLRHSVALRAVAAIPGLRTQRSGAVQLISDGESA